MIVAHLGNGASMCAMQERAVDGLDHGLHRARRPADGHALRPARPGRAALSDGRKEDVAQSRSRISSTRSPASRACRASPRTCASSRPPTARARSEAIDYFVHRIRRELAGLAATVDGVEGVVFTGGIGEHSARVRKAVLTGMEWMGIVIDDEANEASAQIISAKASPAAVFVIPTDEERMIAGTPSKS